LAFVLTHGTTNGTTIGATCRIEETGPALEIFKVDFGETGLPLNRPRVPLN
jgi:hypothetical protein